MRSCRLFTETSWASGLVKRCTRRPGRALPLARPSRARRSSPRPGALATGGGSDLPPLLRGTARREDLPQMGKFFLDPPPPHAVFPTTPLPKGGRQTIWAEGARQSERQKGEEEKETKRKESCVFNPTLKRLQRRRSGGGGRRLDGLILISRKKHRNYFSINRRQRCQKCFS